MGKILYSDPKRRLRPGKASDYILGIDELRPGDKVILPCRVTKLHQYRKGNLDNQEVKLRRIVAERDGVVIAVFHYVGNGAHGEKIVISRPASR